MTAEIRECYAHLESGDTRLSPAPQNGSIPVDLDPMG